MNLTLKLAEPLTSREGKLTLLAILMMLYVIALFLSIAVHEVMGHGIFAVLLGGDVYAVYLSPGSGYVSFWLPPEMTTSEIALIYMAGIAVQLIMGSLLLFLVFPKIKNFILGLFTLMFCVGMTVHSSLYLFMGYIYKSGDTKYAVTLLGIPPDAFMVAGLILTGVFILYISMVALKFLGRHMDLDEDKTRSWTLFLFWFPPLLLGGLISFLYSLTLSKAEIAYPLLNSAILLMFLAIALFLVPMFSEPVKESDHKLSVGSILSVIVVFMVVLAGWAGVFGLSHETAHGLLLHDPPVEVEYFYLDYSLGNVGLEVFANGTVRVDIILRNRMESPSPLESDIYQTFNSRPDWTRYIERSRNIMVTMFDMPRGAGENLTFSTGFSHIRAVGDSDELGRRCTTYISLADSATRQFHITPGDQTPQPGMGIVEGDFVLQFVDPWVSQSGYMDEIKISWNASLNELDILAWNNYNSSIDYNFGDSLENSVGWFNTNPETSPSEYRIIFRLD